MPFAYARLAEITTLGTSPAPVYTLPPDTTAYARLIVLHNTHGAGVRVDLHLVPDEAGAAGSAAAANRFFRATLGAGDTATLDLATPGLVLSDAGDSLQAAADLAGAVTVQIMGGIEQ